MRATVGTPLLAIALGSAGCATPSSPPPLTRPTVTVPVDTPLVASVESESTVVTDVGLVTGFQGIYEGNLQHGRALVAADFDLDGRPDVYLGNPGDFSYVMLNREGSDGLPRFEWAATLTHYDLAWGAAPLDYDNDGDVDLFVTNGGNEGTGFNVLFRNELKETGALSFTDVTAEAGVAGPVPDGDTAPIPVANGNAAVVDFDRDGDEDIFVSVNIVNEGDFSTDSCSYLAGEVSLDALKGRDVLWRNRGDGTFEDATVELGLDGDTAATRNSVFFDADGDGDQDIYLNNVDAPNVMWLNQLVETGTATYVDGTAGLAAAGAQFQFPLQAVATSPDDFDQDGRMDLMVFARDKGAEEGSPYEPGHALFLHGSGGWSNQAKESGLLDVIGQYEPGVMGAQTGDLNLDGRPDVFVGNGGPEAGTSNILYLSAPPEDGRPVVFRNLMQLIDFEPAKAPGVTYPPFPYQTHGTLVLDVDGDALPELLVVEGGPAIQVESREPNRLFKFSFPEAPPKTLSVRLVGDGVTVPVDAIGATVVVHTLGQRPQDFRRTLFVGHGFSAHALFDLDFALPGADAIDAVEVRWTDGTVDIFTEGIQPGTRIAIVKGVGVQAGRPF